MYRKGSWEKNPVFLFDTLFIRYCDLHIISYEPKQENKKRLSVFLLLLHHSLIFDLGISIIASNTVFNPTSLSIYRDFKSYLFVQKERGFFFSILIREKRNYSQRQEKQIILLLVGFSESFWFAIQMTIFWAFTLKIPRTG